MNSEITHATPVRAAVRRRSGSSGNGRKAIPLLGVAVVIGGCGYDTAIYGMYFPSWLVAPVLGAGAAAVTSAALARTRVAPYVPTGIFTFVALTLIYAVLFWGSFFTA